MLLFFFLQGFSASLSPAVTVCGVRQCSAAVGVWVMAYLTSMPLARWTSASGMGLLSQLFVLPHCDGSSR